MNGLTGGGAMSKGAEQEVIELLRKQAELHVQASQARLENAKIKAELVKVANTRELLEFVANSGYAQCW